MRIKFISMLFLMSFVVMANAQETDTTKHITFDDAIVSALAKNPSIDIAEGGLEYNRHMKKAAWGLRLPHINVQGSFVGMSTDMDAFDLNGPKKTAINNVTSFFQSLGITLPEEVVQAAMGLDLRYTIQKKTFAFVNANAVWPIYAGGKINALNRAQKINIEKSENELRIAKADLFSEVAERYWGLALSRSLEGLYSDVVECITSHYNDAVKLEKSGMIAKTERMYAEMSLSKVKASYYEARNNSETVNSALCGSIGEDGYYDPITTLFIYDSLPSLQWFKDQVKDNALLLEKVKYFRELAEENVKGKKADFFPTLAAMGTVNLWNYELTRMVPRAMYGVSASVRIFDGLKTEQTYMASKSQLHQVEATEQKAITDLQILAEKIYYEMVGAREQVYAHENTIKFAEEYYRAKNAAFKEGMATSNDVVDAEVNLSKSKIERMAEAYKFDVALSKLLAMIGNWEEYSVYQMNGREIK